jgi:hypothetical protein
MVGGRASLDFACGEIGSPFSGGQASAGAVSKAVAAMASDDPRRPPYGADERATAASEALDEQGWHPAGADWMAVQLQYGRAASVADVVRLSGVPETTLRRHAEKHGWVQRLPQEEIRGLSRRVWLRGLARGAIDAASLNALLRSSEWRAPEAQAAPPGFAGKTDEELLANFIPYDPEHDPAYEDRILMRSKLDRLIADMERDIALSAAPSGAMGDEGAGTGDLGLGEGVSDTSQSPSPNP